MDYDFSRGHRSRLLLRPVHTHERVHRFFWSTCTVDEFEYRADRRELLRPAPLVHHEISFCPFFSSFFYFDTNEISVRVFHQQWNINASISRVIIFFLRFFFLIIHFCIHEWIEEGVRRENLFISKHFFVGSNKRLYKVAQQWSIYDRERKWNENLMDTRNNC